MVKIAAMLSQLNTSGHAPRVLILNLGNNLLNLLPIASQKNLRIGPDAAVPERTLPPPSRVSPPRSPEATTVAPPRSSARASALDAATSFLTMMSSPQLM
jgi:hypothetical protein